MALIRNVLPTARERLVTLDNAAPVIDAAKLLSTARISLVVVCEPDGVLSGVVTKADVVKQISVCTGCSCTNRVAEIMTREVITCHPEDKLLDVWDVMRKNALRQIPISDQYSRPLGVLYANDALQVLLDETEHEKLFLRDYVMGVGYH